MPFISASKSKEKSSAVVIRRTRTRFPHLFPLSLTHKYKCVVNVACTHTCRRNNIRLLVDKWLNLPDRPVSEGNKREGWSRDGKGRDGRGGEGERT